MNLKKRLQRLLGISAVAVLLGACAAGALALLGGSASSSISSIAALSLIFEAQTTFGLLIPKGTEPQTMALHPDGTRLYVAQQDKGPFDTSNSAAISVIDTARLEVSDTFFTGAEGTATLAFSPDGKQLYVATQPVVGRGELLIVNPATHTVDSSLDFIPQQGIGTPAVTAFTSDSSKAYVAYGASGGLSVAVVDVASQTAIKDIEVLSNPLGVVVSPDDRWVLVANTGDLVGDPNFGIPPSPGEHVTLIDPESDAIVTHIPVGLGPVQIIVTADNKKAYVLNVAGESLSVVDIAQQTVTATLPIGPEIQGMTISSEDNLLYIASQFNGGSITVIDTDSDTVDSIWPVNQRVGPLALDEEQQQLLVVLPEQNQVQALSLTDGSLSHSVATGIEPVAIALNNEQGFALARQSAEVTAFSTATLNQQAAIALRLQPFRLAVAESLNSLVVSNTGHDSINLIDLADNNIQRLRVGQRPVAFELQNTQAWVANQLDENLARVDLVAPQAPNLKPLSGNLPVATALSPGSDRVFVLSDVLDIFDTSSGVLLQSVDLPGGLGLSTALAVRGDGSGLHILTTDLGSFGDSSQILFYDFAQNTLSADYAILEDFEAVDMISAGLLSGGVIVSGTTRSEDNAFLLLIEPLSLTVEQAFATAASHFMALSQDGQTLFVSGADVFGGSGQIDALNTADGSLRFSQSFDEQVLGLALSPDQSRLYAALPETNTVLALDTLNGTQRQSWTLPQTIRP